MPDLHRGGQWMFPRHVVHNNVWSDSTLRAGETKYLERRLLLFANDEGYYLPQRPALTSGPLHDPFSEHSNYTVVSLTAYGLPLLDQEN